MTPNYALGQTVRHTFPSTDANGTPAALANATVAVLKDGSNTPITANVSIEVSLGGRAGQNRFTATMSGNTTNFSAGSTYSAYLATGDVAGTDVANMTIFNWDVENQHIGSTAQATALSTINTSLSNGTANGGGGITMPAPINTFGQFESQTGTGASLALPTQPAGARGAILTPSGGSIVWRGDGGDAASDGSTLAAGGTIAIANIEDFRWCASASVALKIQWLR